MITAAARRSLYVRYGVAAHRRGSGTNRRVRAASELTPRRIVRHDPACTFVMLQGVHGSLELSEARGVVIEVA